MPKARKIIRCLIAFAFALAFAVNSVFASYSDASGYYSCLGGGWNFSSSTGNVTSPSSASGTYQLSTLSVLSGIIIRKRKFRKIRRKSGKAIVDALRISSNRGRVIINSLQPRISCANGLRILKNARKNTQGTKLIGT